MSEVEKEQAGRQELIKLYGASPPPFGPGQSYPEVLSGYALIISYEHTAIDKKNRQVYLGINPDLGWVITRVESDSDFGG